MNRKRIGIDSLSYFMMIAIIYLCSSVFLFPNDYGVLYKVSSRLLIIIFGLFFLLYKKIPIDKDHFFWALSFGFLALLSVVFSVNMDESIAIMLQLYQALIISIIVCAWLNQKHQYIFLFNTIILLSFFYCIRLFIYMNTISWGSRKFSTMLGTNVNSIGLRLSIAASFSLFLYYTVEKRWRIIYLLCNYLFGAMILATGSRRALGLWVISFAIFTLKQATNLRKKAKTLIIILMVLLSLYFMLTRNEALHSIIGYRLENSLNFIISGNRDQIGEADSIRLDLVKEGMILFSQKPILGWGMGTFSEVSNSGHYYSHNNYIELLYSMGLLSIPIYYSIVINRISKVVSIGLKNPKNVLCFVLLVEILFSDVFAPNYYSIISSLSIAIVISMLKDEKNENT